MKGYIIYLFNRKLSKGFKVFLLYFIPTLISLIALYLSYKSYKNSNDEISRNRKPAWIHIIDITDSSFMLQKITFKSSKSEIVLENIEVLLPYPLDQEVPAHISKTIWNCTYVQMNIAETFSTLYECKNYSVLPYTASLFPIYKLPIVIKFSYVENSQLEQMYCFYELGFKYFPIGKVKIYTLNFIKQLSSESLPDIKYLIEYENKVEGFYNSEFAASAELDSLVSKSVFKDLFKHLDSLCHQAYGTFPEVLESAGIKIDSNLLTDSSLILNTIINSPYNIIDSTSVISYVNYIDSTVSDLRGNENYNQLVQKIQELKEWVNKDAFCFYFKSTSDYTSCIINSPWTNEMNYRSWLSQIEDIKMEIFKLITKDPLQFFTN